jgi:hypothetical protein
MHRASEHPVLHKDAALVSLVGEVWADVHTQAMGDVEHQGD